MIACAVCGKALPANRRAVYAPVERKWCHQSRACLDKLDVPIGSLYFLRNPTEESLAKHAAHDESLRQAKGIK